MKIGIRAHSLGRFPLAESALRVGSHGFEFTQLALTKAVTDIDMSKEQLSSPLARRIAEEYGRYGVSTSVLGCYINPIEIDETKRTQEISKFKNYLRYARDFGAAIVATETQSARPYHATAGDGYREAAWNVLRKTVSELVEEAEKYRVYVAVEPVWKDIVSSVSDMRRLLDEIASPYLRVVFDPFNLLHANNLNKQNEMLRAAFEVLGEHIVLLHAKDFTLDGDRKVSAQVGQGVINYPLFLKLAREYTPNVGISIEGEVLESAIPSVIETLRQ